MKELPEDIQAKITAYIEGQLPPDEAAALEVYLANTDPAVSDLVIGMLADRHSVQNLPRVAAPHDLAGRVMEQIERSSLLAGVEHELTTPQRPWWHSRAAIAAALTVVIGGFAYFVVDAIRRPVPQWREPSAAGPSASSPGAVAVVDAQRKLDESGAKIADGWAGKAAAHEEGGVELAKFNQKDAVRQALLSDAAKEVDKLARDGAPGIAAAGGAPAALTMNLKQTPEQQLRTNSDVAAAPDRLAAAKENGYLVEKSPQKALATVYAQDKRSLEGPPVLVTLVSRRADDPQRLMTMLDSFRSQDELIRANSGASARQAFFNGADDRGGVAGGGGSGGGAGLKTSNTAKGVADNGASNYGANISGNITAGNGTLNQVSGKNGEVATANSGRLQYNGNYDNSLGQNEQVTQQAGANAKAGAGMYRREYLRPRQLEQIAAEFQVVSISRGQLAYVIAPTEREGLEEQKVAPAAGEESHAPGGPASAAEGMAAKPTAGVDQPAPTTIAPSAPGRAHPLPIVAATTPATTHGFAGAARGVTAGKSESVADSEVRARREAGQASKDKDVAEQGARADFKYQKGRDVAAKEQGEAGAWLEVLITMEPKAEAAQMNIAPASQQMERRINSK